MGPMNLRKRNSGRALVVLAGLALLASSCGDDGGGDTTTSVASTTSVTSTTSDADPTAEGPRIDFDAELDQDANSAAFSGDEDGASLIMNDVAGSDVGFVAVGSQSESDTRLDAEAAAWFSEDGWNWERVADEDLESPSSMEAVVFTGQGFVAVGTSGRAGDDAAVWRSTDGLDWERLPDDEGSFTAASMSEVAVGERGLVAVGNVSAGDEDPLRAGVWKSGDGETWERIPESALPESGKDVSQSLNGVASTAGSYVVGGVESGEALLWRSEDAESWARVQTDALSDGQAVGHLAGAGGGYVAVGSSYSTSDAIWFSPDSEEWERVDADIPAGLFLASVDASDDGLFVAVGPEIGDAFEEQSPDGSQVWASEDGRIWEQRPFEDEEAATGSMFGVAVFSNGYIAVGQEDSSAQVWVDELEAD